MAIITPDGLFHGDRLKKCSQMAQLFWPFFYIASNTYGRLEINYERIKSRAFPNLPSPPTEEEVIGYLVEYQEAFLLYVYSMDGQFWGQWDTPQENLQTYKSKADTRSPEPPKEEFEQWKEEYRKKKAANQPKSFNLRSLEKVSESLPQNLNGIGVGVGLGVGKAGQGEAKPTTAQALPDWVPVPEWNAFLETRKKLRKPMTEYSTRLILGKLERLSARGHPVKEVLEQSIERGWQSVFPIKDGLDGQQSKSNQRSTKNDEALDRKFESPIERGF